MRRAGGPAATLFRRVFLINGSMFVLGTLLLALSPATVSSRIRYTEIPVLVIGLAVLLAANAVLLRRTLTPLLRFERTSAGATALSAQESERQRIARELHDEIGQTLTVALLLLKRAVDRAPAEIRSEIVDSQEAVRASLDEVRSIVRRLRPDALEDLGLHSALNALCTEFSRATGLSVVKHIAPQAFRLSSDVELVCYRVAQESLTNIARHASANKAWLDLNTTADQLTLRIADDGKGGVTREGAGINGMRERAVLVHANLTITSPKDEGTEVRLVIPLNGNGP
jgi:two-component system sensor histidine kinase UhpB